MKINKFNIDTSDMPTARTPRQFTITGDKGAEFELVVLQNPGSSSAHTLYYDFANSAFETGHNDLHNNLKVKLSSLSYVNSIIFPSGGGDYVIKLMTINGTEISNSNSKVITKSISKAASNTTITFKPGSADTTYYQTLPTSTSVGAVSDTGIVNFSWSVLNSTTDAKSFGFKLTEAEIATFDSTYWYFQTTENVADNPAGDGEDSLTVTIADTADLCVGMELKYHKGTTVPTNKAGSAVGATGITAIDTSTKIVTFSKAVAFEDGETMTFRAYGRTFINDAIGLDFTPSNVSKSTTLLTKTVEARDGVTETTDGSSANIALPNTLGIGVGFNYKGLGVNNVSSNLITSVTPDGDGSGNDGLMVVELAQLLAVGTVLTFSQTLSQIDFEGIITISQYPSADQTINLDLDKILTVGAGS
tara:strand:- start:144 stop:1397 length:1254 start_codon:yes stop_codon:yes gene_type:complete